VLDPFSMVPLAAGGAQLVHFALFIGRGIAKSEVPRLLSLQQREARQKARVASTLSGRVRLDRS
jgi:hypothetical protein